MGHGYQLETYHLQLTKGQTWSREYTVRDQVTRQLTDLTGASVYMWIRADLKLTDAQVKLASETTSGHRVGIVINADQDGYGKGKFIVTLIPGDTDALTACGHDDPYFYDIWVMSASGAEYPIMALSQLDLYDRGTIVP